MERGKMKEQITDADRAWHRAHPAFDKRAGRRRLDDYGVEIEWANLGKRKPGGWEVCRYKAADKGEAGPVAVGYILIEDKWVIDTRTHEVHQHKELRRPPIDLT